MKPNFWKTLSVCLVAVLAVTLLAQPAMADGDEQQKRVKKIIKCEDGDCTETIENLGGGDEVKIIIGGDGDAEKHIKIHKIKCDGENCDHAKGHKMVFVGDGGDKHVKIHKIECDGEDCDGAEGHKMVFVGDDGDIEVMSGGEGHAWVSHGGGHGGGFLGVQLTELTPELREHFGVSGGSGVMVSKVVVDSPAFKAGLEVGDIVSSVDGESVESGSALAKMIRGHDDGDEVVLNVWRDGAAQSISAAVEEREGHVRIGNMDALHRNMGGLHERMSDMHKRMRKVMIKCDSEDGDCESNVDIAGLDDFDCGGGEECEVKVSCSEGDCTCTVNGEDTDCAGIPGVPSSND